MIDSRLNRETRTEWLLSYLSETGEATAAQIAEQMGWSVQHTHKVMTELETAGLISRERRGPTYWGQGRRPTLFRVRNA